MDLRTLNIADYKDIARIHLDSFPGFFLSTLGERFLRVFYKALLKDKETVNIGLFDQEILLGFAIGSLTSASFYKKILIKNFLKLGIAGIIPLTRKPKSIFRLCNSLITSNKMELPGVNPAILLSICVHSNYKSQGKGQILLHEFEKVVFSSKSAIILTTDHDHNTSVNKFYLKNSYQLLRQVYQGQRKMNLYIKYKS